MPFVEAMEGEAAKHPNHFTPQCSWILSLDQASIHTSENAGLSEAGLEEGKNLIWNPARSGDLHKPIENVHAMMVAWYMEVLRNEKGCLTVEQHKKKFRDLFFNKLTPDIIQKDILHLKHLYAKVIKAKGWWGPNKDRWAKSMVCDYVILVMDNWHGQSTAGPLLCKHTATHKHWTTLGVGEGLGTGSSGWAACLAFGRMHMSLGTAAICNQVKDQCCRVLFSFECEHCIHEKCGGNGCHQPCSSIVSYPPPQLGWLLDMNPRGLGLQPRFPCLQCSPLNPSGHHCNDTLCSYSAALQKTYKACWLNLQNFMNLENLAVEGPRGAGGRRAAVEGTCAKA